MYGPGSLTEREKKAVRVMRGLRDVQIILNAAGLGSVTKKTEGESPVLSQPDIAIIIDNSDEGGNILTVKNEIITKKGIDSKAAAFTGKNGSDLVLNIALSGGEASSMYTALREGEIENAVKLDKNPFLKK